MRFIGRNAELQQLSRFLDRSPDSLAVVYGRRRVGKSELLRQALKHSGLQYVFFETSAFYPDFSDEDKVRLYSVFGAIPDYTRKIDPLLTVKENILNLVEAKDSKLAIAINHFLLSEISKINNANLVFSALSKGTLKFSDLLAKTQLPNGAILTYTLNKLMSMGLIEKRAPINDEKNKRRTLYGIVDPLTSYYYRFVKR